MNRKLENENCNKIIGFFFSKDILVLRILLWRPFFYRIYVIWCKLFEPEMKGLNTNNVDKHRIITSKPIESLYNTVSFYIIAW